MKHWTAITETEKAIAAHLTAILRDLNVNAIHEDDRATVLPREDGNNPARQIVGVEFEASGVHCHWRIISWDSWEGTIDDATVEHYGTFPLDEPTSMNENLDAIVKAVSYFLRPHYPEFCGL